MAELNDKAAKAESENKLRKSASESGSSIPKDAPKQPGESVTDYAKRRMKQEWEAIKHPGQPS